MKHIISLVLFITAFNSFLSAQVFPDYKERFSINFTDSLSQQNLATVTASEGNVNPDEYVIGPGDKIFISISGAEEIPLNLLVNQEGYLYIPKVGGIDLRKTTLNKAKEKILASINKYYRNVDIFISLTDFRKNKVSLLGDVKKPSTYVLPGNARLLDLLVVSSGINPTANYRNIKIVHKDKNSETYDLLHFLRFGSTVNNPLLQEGDVVLVDKADAMVYISGLIKYPGGYEHVPGESIMELIDLAGGLLHKARKDSIEVISFDPDGIKQISEYYSTNELIVKDQQLQKQAQVIVREIPEYFIDRYVSINGFIKYPGYYKINKDQTTLVDIINEAGGFKKDASLTEANLYRTQGITDNDPEFERLKLIPRADMNDDEYDYLKAKSRQRYGRVIVDFKRLFIDNDLSENVILKRGDVITIPESKNYIIVLGQVVNPGNVIYNPNLNVDDYIQLAGGFGWRAQEGDVRVIKAMTGEWIDADDVEHLEPGDTIWILEEPQPPKFWEVFTTSLNILGQLAAVVAATIAVIIATR